MKDPEVERTMRGIRRVKGIAPNGKAPILTPLLRQMVEVLPDDLPGLRDKAILLIGFAGAFRRSEIVDLQVRDVQMSDVGLIITLRRSKTDQEGASFTKGIPIGTSDASCAKCALEAWLQRAGISSGPIFRPVDRWGHVGTRALSSLGVARAVKRALTALNVDTTNYSGHSLRAVHVSRSGMASILRCLVFWSADWAGACCLGASMARTTNDNYFETAELFERGWTDALIGRFLGDADRQARNRSDPGGALRQWYRKDRVLAREQDATVARALRRAAARGERKRATARRGRVRDFSLFKDYFPRALARRVVFFCGPTNSGKTYHALNALCQHTSGVYLAPLRLLALEGQEEIERRSQRCSLMTGDERDLKPDAPFRAQTIESLNYDHEVDAILIDEVQMLLDAQRGAHWVSALIGAPAATIYLAGSPEALAYVEQICAYVDGALEVHTLERLAPLQADAHPRSLREALAPTGRKAFIVFSRQAIFDLKDAVEAQGQQAAVIYGSLGPAVRRTEAERFRSGACPVVIATDAIGMGLNLPIDRLYFATTRKWDGTQERA